MNPDFTARYVRRLNTYWLRPASNDGTSVVLANLPRMSDPCHRRTGAWPPSASLRPERWTEAFRVFYVVSPDIMLNYVELFLHSQADASGPFQSSGAHMMYWMLYEMPMAGFRKIINDETLNVRYLSNLRHAPSSYLGSADRYGVLDRPLALTLGLDTSEKALW